jgi:hypothetical protein
MLCHVDHRIKLVVIADNRGYQVDSLSNRKVEDYDINENILNQ